MEEKRARVESVTSSFTAVRDKHVALEKTLASAEELLQTLLTGLSSNNDGNTGGGYLGQIADARGRASEARAEEEQANVKLQMSEKELKALQERWKAVEREANDGARKLEGMQATVESFRRKMAETGWTNEKEQAQETALRDARNDVRRLTEVRSVLRSQHTVTDTLLDARFREVSHV